MGNYTSEFIALALEHSRNFAAANPRLSKTTVEHIEGLCNIVESLATLRQQAGRVDVDGIALEAAREIVGMQARNHAQHVAKIQIRIASALTAALAQNTQGEAVAWRYRATDGAGNLLPGWHYSDDPGSLGLREPLYLHAERARVPEGCVLVPCEPTEEMLEATRKCVAPTLVNTSIRRTISRAMLAAAPSQRAEVK